MHSGPSPQEIDEVLKAFMPMIMVVLVIMSVIQLAMMILYVVIFCKLFQKMGHPWALGFLILIPLASLFVMLYMAFSRWPVLEELDRLRAAAAAGGTPPAAPPLPPSTTPHAPAPAP